MNSSQPTLSWASNLTNRRKRFHSNISRAKAKFKILSTTELFQIQVEHKV